MKLSSQNFTDGAPIPDQFACCIPSATDHLAPGDNHNPELNWTDVPEGTRSFVLICHDPDAPSQVDDVNQDDRTVHADFPRAEFIHWVLVDLPATLRQIEAASFSSGFIPCGKSGPATLHHARHGLNDYTTWFASDETMRGNYYGYDGPCPPWNDERIHRYVFTLYALDIEHCPVTDPFHAAGVREAIAKHTLAKASLTGTYTLNPALRR